MRVTGEGSKMITLFYIKQANEFVEFYLHTVIGRTQAIMKNNPATQRPTAGFPECVVNRNCPNGWKAQKGRDLVWFIQ